MNIKEWKQFSDAVDNVKREAVTKMMNWRQENPYIVDRPMDYGWKYDAAWKEFSRNVVEKTEVNFWEWKAGKLKL